MMEKIRESLIFDRVVVWDNSIDPDWKCAGRYTAALYADTEWVYWQDDDVIVPPETQQALIDDHRAGQIDCLANYGHGTNPDGYDDLPLVCGGAIASRLAAWDAILRYGAHEPLGSAFKYEADFVVGVLYHHWEHVHLPFHIEMPVAQHPSRLCNQPWQRDLKLETTNKARAIRDKDAR